MNDTERRALALSGAGDIVFDWDVVSDNIFVSPEVEHQLGLKRGSLEGPASAWLDLIHPFDKDRYRASLDAVIEQRRGRLTQDFRLRSASGAHHWFRLKARPVIGSDGEVIRIVGTLADVTDSKTAEERLLHDAVHDNLTSLPNRQLFYDRLEAALTFAEPGRCPAPDRARRSTSTSSSRSTMPSAMRRATRSSSPCPAASAACSSRRTRWRASSGDEFAIILLSEREPDRIIAFADMVRRAVTTPITYAEREIFLTASIGIALHDPQIAARREEVLRNAEIAMAHAQAPRRRPDRGVPPDHALRPQRPFHAGNRPAPGARPQRDEGAVQADRAPRGPHHRGLRVDAALGSSRGSAASAPRTSCRSPRKPASSSS